MSAGFWAIHPRVCGDGAFTRDFLAGELVDLYFELWFSFFIIIIIIMLGID